MDDLYHRETALIQAQQEPNPELMSLWLADNFIEFGSSGRMMTKTDALKSLGTFQILRWEIQDFNTLLETESVIIVTYMSTFVLNVRGETVVKRALRSSTWHHYDGQWRMVFHQGTPMAETP